MNPSLIPAERVLLGPGPSPVPHRVLRALGAPTLGHLDPQYLAIMDHTCELLRQVFQTRNPLTFPVSGTGMAGMECLATNLIEPGDEVIVFEPAYDSYDPAVRLAGAVPIHLPLAPPHYRIDWAAVERAITPRTRLFVLNSPSNPTGSVYTPDEVKALGDICVEKGALIMSDEIYEHLLYDGATVKSVASFSQAHCDHTIIVHGFAKAWSMTGWRLGWTAAPEPIAKAIDAIQGHSTSNPTSFAQKGAVAALNGSQTHLPKWLGEFAQRRSFAHAQLNAMPGVTCANAKGAFYLFPNISGTGLKSTEFCARLLEQEKVAAVPGIAFGADDYIRLSYATSLANIQKGLERMDCFVRGLKR